MSSGTGRCVLDQIFGSLVLIFYFQHTGKQVAVFTQNICPMAARVLC